MNNYLVSIHIMNPTEKSPERRHVLQKYLLLHSQHEALQRQQQKRGSISNAQLVGTSTITRTSSQSDPIDESALGEIEDSENRLISVIEQIKCTLTELLNSKGVEDDSRYKMWVQTKLMNAEKELKGFRTRNYETNGSIGIKLFSYIAGLYSY